MTRSPAWRAATLAFTLAAAAFAAHAADPVTDAMQQAYAPYRAALFHTNGTSVDEAAKALAAARAAWSPIVDRFAASRPTPYADDARFGATLKEVERVYAQAAQLVAAGKLADAHEALERVRDELTDLRRRNSVVVFSDAMNDFHAEMETVLKDGPAMLNRDDGRLQLIAQVGVLEYLARRLPTEAPASLQRDAAFVDAQAAVAAAVARLKGALMRQDLDAARQALPALKPPYSRMFLRFG